MNATEKLALEHQYIRQFGGGLEEIVGSNDLLFEERYWEMLKQALQRGVPLTAAEVRAAFPDAAWEE